MTTPTATRRTLLVAGGALLVLLAVTGVLGRRRFKVWRRQPLPAARVLEPPNVVPGAPSDFPTVVEVSPGGPDDFERVLRQLEDEGREHISDALREWAQNVVADRPPQDTVVVGRVVTGRSHPCVREEARGNCPNQDLNPHTHFFADGYFVMWLGDWRKPIELRGEMLEPTDIQLRSAPGTLAWLGTIPVAALAPSDVASFKCTLALDDLSADQVTVTFTPHIEANTSVAPGGYLGSPLTIDAFSAYARRPSPTVLLTDDGTLTVEGLTPMKYHVSIEAPGRVTRGFQVRLGRGERLEVPAGDGTLKFEMLQTVTLEYLTSADAGFHSAAPHHLELQAEEKVSVVPDAGAAFDFRLRQSDGEFTLLEYNSHQGQGFADLGDGTLESFRDLDVRQLTLREEDEPKLVRRHVYLFRSYFEHWVLFRFDQK